MIGMLEEAWNLFEKPDMAALSGVPGLGSRVMVIQTYTQATHMR